MFPSMGKGIYCNIKHPHNPPSNEFSLHMKSLHLENILSCIRRVQLFVLRDG